MNTRPVKLRALTMATAVGLLVFVGGCGSSGEDCAAASQLGCVEPDDDDDDDYKPGKNKNKTKSRR